DAAQVSEVVGRYAPVYRPVETPRHLRDRGLAPECRGDFFAPGAVASVVAAYVEHDCGRAQLGCPLRDVVDQRIDACCGLAEVVEARDRDEPDALSLLQTQRGGWRLHLLHVPSDRLARS